MAGGGDEDLGGGGAQGVADFGDDDHLWRDLGRRAPDSHGGHETGAGHGRVSAQHRVIVQLLLFLLDLDQRGRGLLSLGHHGVGDGGGHARLVEGVSLGGGDLLECCGGEEGGCRGDQALWRGEDGAGASVGISGLQQSCRAVDIDEHVGWGLLNHRLPAGGDQSREVPAVLLDDPIGRRGRDDDLGCLTGDGASADNGDGLSCRRGSSCSCCWKHGSGFGENMPPALLEDRQGLAVELWGGALLLGSRERLKTSGVYDEDRCLHGQRGVGRDLREGGGGHRGCGHGHTPPHCGGEAVGGDGEAVPQRLLAGGGRHAQLLDAIVFWFTAL